MKGPAKSSRMCPTSNSQTASFSPLPPLLPHLCCEGGRHVTGHLLVHQGNQLDAWGKQECMYGEDKGRVKGLEGECNGAKRTAPSHQQIY